MLRDQDGSGIYQLLRGHRGVWIWLAVAGCVGGSRATLPGRSRRSRTRNDNRGRV